LFAYVQIHTNKSEDELQYSLDDLNSVWRQVMVVSGKEPIRSEFVLTKNIGRSW